MISLTVSGGSGSVSFDFGNASFNGASIVSPDSTPMYDFRITDSDGHLQMGAVAIDSQKCVIKEFFVLIGVCTITISGAVDDGIYTIKLQATP